MLATPLERFEAKFTPLLTEARGLSASLWSAIDANFVNGIPGNQFPEITASRLVLASTPLYDAGVASLAEPETTLASLALMRSLIEAWGHLYFVMGTDLGADRACRAMRVEHGWASQTLGLAQASDDQRLLEIAQRRQEAIIKLKDQADCKGTPRDYRHTGPMVKDLAARLRIEWLPEAWRAASQMAHAAGWEWSIEVLGDGSSSIKLPAPSHRAAQLNHLVIVFNNLAQTALVVLGIMLDSDPAQALHDAALKILDDRFLHRAIERDYD